MAENLCEEDIVGDVFGFEHVATYGAVGRAQAAWFPWLVEGAEGGGNVLGCGPAEGGAKEYLGSLRPVTANDPQDLFVVSGS